MTLRRGDLVIYDHDRHRVGAESLYVVLGAGEPGRNGEARTRIRPVHCNYVPISHPSAAPTLEFDAVTTSLHPLPEFGMRFDRVIVTHFGQGGRMYELKVARDPMLAETGKWGRRYGATWDYLLSTSVADEMVAKLIIARANRARSSKVERAA